MQELLARLKALDPQASMTLRIIACFDELVRGNVNTHALLGAAASMAGCVAGMADESSGRSERVDPSGSRLPPMSTDGEPERLTRSADGLSVWLEKPGPPSLNDAMLLERLNLAVAVRWGAPAVDERRALAALLDPETPADRRRELASKVGLVPNVRYRIAALPLFATWGEHPHMPEDVVATPFGPIHVAVLGSDVHDLDARPCGIGSASEVGSLHTSLESALVALRLTRVPESPVVSADEYGGILELIARSSPDRQEADSALLVAVMTRSWAVDTLEALVRTNSVREAARAVGVHHSTMQRRLDEVAQVLGFDPMDGLGRTRLGVAFLSWRLHNSTVLDLPPPSLQT